MSKKDPGKVLRALDAIAAKMDALRAGALTTEEAFQKAEDRAKEFKKLFPLAIDEILDAKLGFDELLKKLKELQETDFKPNLQRQMTKEDRATLAHGGIPEGYGEGLGSGPLTAPPGTVLSAEDQMMLLRGGVGPGMSRGPAESLPGRQGQAWGESLTPADALLARQLSGEIAANMQEANAFADQLEATANRFEAAFPNSYFTAVVLKMEIPYLRIGARSAGEARRYIQAFQSAFLPGFQASLQNPNLPPGLRALTQEAIQILLSGQVSGGAGAVGGALTIGPTPRRAPAPEQIPPYTTAEEARVSGISGGGGDRGGGVGVGAGAVATRSDLAALSATITRSGEQQANRVIAGVGQQTAEIRSSVNAQSSALRTIQEADVQANRELAEQFRQVGQRVETGVRTIGLNALSAVALRDALERLQLSGALSTGTTQ